MTSTLSSKHEISSKHEMALGVRIESVLSQAHMNIVSLVFTCLCISKALSIITCLILFDEDRSTNKKWL